MSMDIDTAREKMLVKLDYGIRTKQYMRDEMRRLKVDIDDAEQIIEQFEETGLLNDEYYAKQYVQSVMYKYGAKRILSELIKKGIDKETAQNAIDSEYNIDTDVLYELIKKRLNNDFDRKNIEKVIRHCISKGYEYDDIKRNIEEIKMQNGAETEGEY